MASGVELLITTTDIDMDSCLVLRLGETAAIIMMAKATKNEDASVTCCLARPSPQLFQIQDFLLLPQFPISYSCCHHLPPHVQPTSMTTSSMTRNCCHSYSCCQLPMLFAIAAGLSLVVPQHMIAFFMFFVLPPTTPPHYPQH